MQLYYFYLGRKKIDYSETNNVSLFASYGILGNDSGVFIKLIAN